MDVELAGRRSFGSHTIGVGICLAVVGMTRSASRIS